VRLPGDNHLLSETARDLGKILAPRDIFQRGGLVFVLNERKDGFALMTPEMLRTWIEDYLVCYRVIKPKESETVIQLAHTISQTDAAGILAAPQFIEQLQQVERFNPIRMPVMRKDGWIELLTEGYDAQTKTFTLDEIPVVNGMPVPDAKGILDHLLSEFVFADAGRSKAVALASMLTMFGRGLIPPKALRPCFIFLANAEGAGKTLLVKCATVPVLGYVPTGTKPKDEEEMRKVLLTAVLEGSPAIFFDNAKRHITSEALEGFLTAQDYGARILGKSETFRGANNAVVFITGNRCTVSPDLRRRSLFCELFLEVERAEDRVFHQNLEVPMLLDQRSDILTAWWTLIQDWDKAMRPKPTRTNSSFADWSEVIGGIVEHAGYGCPLETPPVESADVDGADMRTLVTALADGAVFKSLKFEEVVETARAGGLFERLIPEQTELDQKARATFAGVLKSFDRRLVGDFRFTLVGKGHDRRFEVERLQR
jgi:hypothetical protein